MEKQKDNAPKLKESLNNIFHAPDADFRETLRLRSRGLWQLPADIKNLIALENLFLANNRLRTLPDELGALKNIRSLGLWENRFVDFPAVICQLDMLENLYMHINQLDALPEDIAQMKSLRKLSLYNNNITALPDGLCELTQLSDLLLSHNPLTSLPDRIGNLENLKFLNLSHTEISDVPDSFFTLPKLESLWVVGCENLIVNDALIEKFQAMPSLRRICIQQPVMGVDTAEEQIIFSKEEKQRAQARLQLTHKTPAPAENSINPKLPVKKKTTRKSKPLIREDQEKLAFIAQYNDLMQEYDPKKANDHLTRAAIEFLMAMQEYQKGGLVNSIPEALAELRREGRIDEDFHEFCKRWINKGTEARKRFLDKHMTITQKGKDAPTMDQEKPGKRKKLGRKIIDFLRLKP